ncbi:MAG: hypothetical protein H6Q71_2810, partial [Firmicutes bacterium]|nr:hypothetical protein [Bacillota bacterium]
GPSKETNSSERLLSAVMLAKVFLQHLRDGVLVRVGFDKVFVHNFFVATRLVYCCVSWLLCMAG